MPSCRFHGTQPTSHFYITSSKKLCRELWEARHRRYNHSAKGKARFHRYDMTAKGKARDWRYNQTEKGRARYVVYDLSERGHFRKRFYDNSQKGRAMELARRVGYEQRT